MFILLLFVVLVFISNCFSQLRPPPITFTQTQTSAERQMIGEDKELEKDGWLLSSVRSSAVGTEEWRGEVIEEFEDTKKTEHYLNLQRTNAYQAGKIRRLKTFGVIGEGLDGKIGIIKNQTSLGFEREYPNVEDKKKFEETVKLVNDVRAELRSLRLEKLKTQVAPEEWKRIESDMILEYWKEVLVGDYYEQPKGKWRKKE
jgi:hypothetical protein